MEENNRLIQIVLNDLNNDKLKAEEELERVINDKSIDIDNKLVTIKLLLSKINNCNQMIITWAAYTVVQPESENNNNNS